MVCCWLEFETQWRNLGWHKVGTARIPADQEGTVPKWEGVGGMGELGWSRLGGVRRDGLGYMMGLVEVGEGRWQYKAREYGIVCASGVRCWSGVMVRAWTRARRPVEDLHPEPGRGSLKWLYARRHRSNFPAVVRRSKSCTSPGSYPWRRALSTASSRSDRATANAVIRGDDAATTELIAIHVRGGVGCSGSRARISK